MSKKKAYFDLDRLVKRAQDAPGDHQTIEVEYDDLGRPEGYKVMQHGEYGRDSVLEGQYRRTFLDFYPTIEEAQQNYPEAEVIGHSTRDPGRSAEDALPKSPPSWFDPSAAGEHWDDDY